MIVEFVFPVRKKSGTLQKSTLKKKIEFVRRGNMRAPFMAFDWNKMRNREENLKLCGACTSFFSHFFYRRNCWEMGEIALLHIKVHEVHLICLSLKSL